jgi:Uma2 family endonuclease
MLTQMPEKPPGRPATYQDLLAVPDNLVAEILDGVLYTSPRPAPRHAVANARLIVDLIPPYNDGRGGPGGWLILAEPEVHLASDVVVPDLAGWRRERMPRLPKEAYFPTAPDWACEVLSPSTRRMDRRKKLPIYARERVAYLWLVDPDARTVEVLRLESGHWVIDVVAGDDDKVRLQPFADIEIDLQDLWAE